MLLIAFVLATLQVMVSAATITASSFTQIPSTAAGPPVPTPSAYRLESFGGGANMVTDGIYQAMFLVACEIVIAVDAPPSIGINMLKAIRSVTDKPVSHVIYSHAHADHIGGAYLYGDPTGLGIVAHRFTAEYLALVSDYDHRPAPTITFEDDYTLRVCNQSLQLDYRGPNHEPGNIFIYAPHQKVLMPVDIVYPGWTPFNALGEVESVPGYIRAHDQLLTYDFDHYIGGHLDQSGTRQDVAIAREYLYDLYNTSVLAIQMSAQPNNSLSITSTIGPYAEKVTPGRSSTIM